MSRKWRNENTIFFVILFILCCTGPLLLCELCSSCSERGGSSLAVGCGLLIVVTSPVVKHGLQGEWASAVVH